MQNIFTELGIQSHLHHDDVLPQHPGFSAEITKWPQLWVWKLICNWRHSPSRSLQ